MQQSIRSPRPRNARSRTIRCALALWLLACLALAACGEADPLEAIRQQQATGDFEGSIEPLRELLAADPDDPEANFLYGRALALTQRASLATWSLRKAMESPDWLVPAGLQLAHAALGTEDFNEVIEVTTRILEQHPDDVSALLFRSQAHAHWHKNPELALADAERVLELDPERIEAYEPRILALLGLHQREEANAALAEVGRKLETLDVPEDLHAWHCAMTAVSLWEIEDIDGARAHWPGCLEAYPAQHDVVWNSMKFYQSQGEPARVLEIAEAALAAAPESRVYRAIVAERLVMAGRLADADALLREATGAEDPQTAVAAWVDLAKLHQLTQEYDEAADAMERALELAGEAASPQLRFQYADALISAGRLERALAVAETITVPAHQHLVRARVLQERRNPVAALAEFEKGLQLWPDNASGRYYAGLAALETGEFDRALEGFRYSIRIAAGATDARVRAARQLLAEGRPGPALQLLRLKADREPLSAEGEMLSIHLWSLLGMAVQAERVVGALGEGGSPWFTRAAVELAEGAAKRSGPAAGLTALQRVPGLDLEDPRRAEALRALVRLSHEAGDPATAKAAVESALAAHPEAAVFHEIRGLHLERSGAPEEAVRSAFSRALELEPANAAALLGLCRLRLGEDPEEALALADRAAAADPLSAEPGLLAAKALLALGKPDEAGERLDALLVEHPFEVEAAALRAQLDVERGVVTARTLERARRAARFGGGANAFELMSTVQTELGRPEEAARSAERARVLREGRAADG